MNIPGIIKKNAANLIKSISTSTTPKCFAVIDEAINPDKIALLDKSHILCVIKTFSLN